MDVRWDDREGCAEGKNKEGGGWLTNDLCQARASALGGINQLDKARVRAEEFDLCRVDVPVGCQLADSLQDFVGVPAGFVLVDVLQLDVDVRLGLHVGETAGDRQDLVLFVEVLDCLCDDPEAGLDLVLEGVSAF